MAESMEVHITSAQRTATAAIKRICSKSKAFNKKNHTHCPDMLFYMDDLYYAFCPYYGVRLRWNPTYLDAEHVCYAHWAVSFDKVLDEARTSFTEITSYIPRLKQLRLYEKAYKTANENPCCMDGGGVPMFIGDDLVNTRYLYDLLKLLPDARVFVESDKMCHAIIFISCAGRGMLIPILPLGAVNGEKEFKKNYGTVNPPRHPENVFYNKSLTRYTI